MSWHVSDSPAIAPPSHDRDEDDAALVAKARHGDQRAFALLYRCYLDRVYDYCRRRLPDREAAEDATQTIFIRAFTSIRSCRDDALFAGWLFAIARNVITDAYRSSRVAVSSLDDRVDLHDPDRSPEEQAIGSEWGRELGRLRQDCLKADDRDLLDLRLQDLTDQEIALALHRSYGAIRVAQHRMVRRLRDCLGLNREGRHAVP